MQRPVTLYGVHAVNMWTERPLLLEVAVVCRGRIGIAEIEVHKLWQEERIQVAGQ